ncbi:MAG: hypothetical protein COX17_07945, partial [Deltaproteobacteria bacterium CG23_combo_of_CG06-09_8_20_14_all_60_8]
MEHPGTLGAAPVNITLGKDAISDLDPQAVVILHECLPMQPADILKVPIFDNKPVGHIWAVEIAREATFSGILF